jgi:hypothetical protein
MTLAEASLQNRYAQSLQPDTRLSVISYRFVFTACISRRPFPCPDNCAGAAVGNVGKALTIFLLFFVTTSYDIKPLMYAFFPTIVFHYAVWMNQLCCK